MTLESRLTGMGSDGTGYGTKKMPNLKADTAHTRVTFCKDGWQAFLSFLRLTPLVFLSAG